MILRSCCATWAARKSTPSTGKRHRGSGEWQEQKSRVRRKAVSTKSRFGNECYPKHSIRSASNPARSVGEPFRVTAFENPAQLVPDLTGNMSMSLTQNRLVLPLTYVSGSIWMLDNLDR